MAAAEVILKEKIEGLGVEADIVSVRRGHAMNYLIPQGKAYEATRANKRHLESLQASRAQREAEELNDAEQQATKLRKIKITLPLSVGQGGKAFGSITINDLLQAITDRTKLELDRRQILLENPIKSLGEYDITVQVHPDIEVVIPLKVKAEEEGSEEA